MGSNGVFPRLAPVLVPYMIHIKVVEAAKRVRAEVLLLELLNSIHKQNFKKPRISNR
jgi:hypothetical protein